MRLSAHVHTHPPTEPHSTCGSQARRCSSLRHHWNQEWGYVCSNHLCWQCSADCTVKWCGQTDHCAWNGICCISWDWRQCNEGGWYVAGRKRRDKEGRGECLHVCVCVHAQGKTIHPKTLFSFYVHVCRTRMYMYWSLYSICSQLLFQNWAVWMLSFWARSWVRVTDQSSLLPRQSSLEVGCVETHCTVSRPLLATWLCSCLMLCDFHQNSV